MKRIAVPTVSFAVITTTLNNTSYNLTFRWNEVKERWKLDIQDASFNDILLGVTLIEGENLTGYYPQVTKLLDGFLFLVKMNESEEKAGRNNIGFNKTYELVYLSNNE